MLGGSISCGGVRMSGCWAAVACGMSTPGLLPFCPVGCISYSVLSLYNSYNIREYTPGTFCNSQITGCSSSAWVRCICCSCSG